MTPILVTAARALFFLSLGVACSAPVRLVAQNGAAVAKATRVEKAPTIDGILDDASWTEASRLGDFVQRDPVEGEPVSERTEVRITYDDQAVYIGAWLFDRDPNGIVYGETRRDADPKDSDALLLVFDTYLDRQKGFLFATTPAGIEYDGQITREGQGGARGPRARQRIGSGGGFNVNWDGSWQVATTRDGEGWYAEFRIPFSTLRYTSGGAQRWGFNVARRIRRNSEESFWSPVARQFNVFRVSSAGVLEGFDAPARRTATFTPYLLGSGRRDYTVSSGPDDDLDGDVGFDVKLVSASSMTLDLTYNTDFAQVEVDEQEVNLTRFSLYLPREEALLPGKRWHFRHRDPAEQRALLQPTHRDRRRSGSPNSGRRTSYRPSGRTHGGMARHPDRVCGRSRPSEQLRRRTDHEGVTQSDSARSGVREPLQHRRHGRLQLHDSAGRTARYRGSAHVRRVCRREYHTRHRE